MMRLKIPLFIVFLSLISLAILAQQPDTEEPEKTKEEELEETKEEIRQLIEELKGIDQTRSKLEDSRDKLRQLVINNNEASAIKMLSLIASACESYRENQNLASYPWSLKDLQGYIPEQLMNAVDADSALYGYYYQYSYVTKDRFTVKAFPAEKGKTGERTFRVDQDGRIVDDALGN